MFKLTTDDTEGQTQEITTSLDELTREGARRMIAATPETEVMLVRHHLYRYPVPDWVHQQVYLHPYPKQTITMSNPFLINVEKVREHSSRKTSFSKLQARYEPDE